MFSIQSFYDFYYSPSNHSIYLSESQLSFLIYLRRKIGWLQWILLFIPWNVFFFSPEITVIIFKRFYFVNNWKVSFGILPSPTCLLLSAFTEDFSNRFTLSLWLNISATLDRSRESLQPENSFIHLHHLKIRQSFFSVSLK